MTKKKRPRARQEDNRTKQNSTGPNSRKTRPDAPTTTDNKAASGKRVQRGGVRGGQG